MIKFHVFVLMFLTMIGLISALVEETRYYNKINFHNFTKFDDFRHNLLEQNADGELVTKSNIILGISSPECDHLLESPAFRASQRYAGGDVLFSASLPASEFPYPIDGCAEVAYYRIRTPLNEPNARTTELDHRSLTQLIQDQIRLGVTFYNDFSFPIELVWNDESKDPIKQGILEPGESYFIHSFIGHTFSAHMIDSGEELGPVVDFMVIIDDNYHFNPINRQQSCESYDDDYLFIPNHCQDMNLRFEQFLNWVFHQKRLGLNYVQPKFVPPVTAEGFLHRKLPNSTYTWLKQWYDAEQLRLGGIESKAGPCMNQLVAPSVIAHLTPSYKDQLAAELKPILHEWYGKDKGDLELTSIYGIRKYTNGSILRMHVDTVNTHVVSAIINVDQAVEKDWPLLILDHDGFEHNVIMQPGDMVLYESAKLLHGRPDVFIGDHYDNIFIHFRPVAGWDYSWI
jgi:hypothetical protein